MNIGPSTSQRLSIYPPSSAQQYPFANTSPSPNDSYYSAQMDDDILLNENLMMHTALQPRSLHSPAGSCHSSVDFGAPESRSPHLSPHLSQSPPEYRTYGNELESQNLVLPFNIALPCVVSSATSPQSTVSSETQADSEYASSRVVHTKKVGINRNKNPCSVCSSSKRKCTLISENLCERCDKNGLKRCPSPETRSKSLQGRTRSTRSTRSLSDPVSNLDYNVNENPQQPPYLVHGDAFTRQMYTNDQIPLLTPQSGLASNLNGDDIYTNGRPAEAYHAATKYAIPQPPLINIDPTSLSCPTCQTPFDWDTIIHALSSLDGQQLASLFSQLRVQGPYDHTISTNHNTASYDNY